jgi:hypothetical protein
VPGKPRCRFPVRKDRKTGNANRLLRDAVSRCRRTGNALLPTGIGTCLGDAEESDVNLFSGAYGVFPSSPCFSGKNGV